MKPFIAVLLLISTHALAGGGAPPDSSIHGVLVYNHPGVSQGGTLTPRQYIPSFNNPEILRQRDYLTPRINSFSGIETQKMIASHQALIAAIKAHDLTLGEKELESFRQAFNETIRLRNEMVENGASHFRSLGGGGTLTEELDYNIKSAREIYTDAVKQFNEGVEAQRALEQKKRDDSHAAWEKRFEEIRNEVVPIERGPPIDLSTIPDTHTPSYFHSPPGEFRTRLDRLNEDLGKMCPLGQTRVDAACLGQDVVWEADASYVAGDLEEANFFYDVGKGFLDVAVGVDPVTGLGRSAYELLVGKNLITGVTLTGMERSVAFVGVMTAGTGRTAVQVAQGMNKIFKGATTLLKASNAQAAIREGSRLAERLGSVVQGFTKNHRITAIKSAEEVNVKYVAHGYNRPYQDGSHVVEFITQRDSNWIRVHGENNQVGNWVIKKNSIYGLTPDQVRVKYALPHTPTHVSDVRVPKETPMSRGNVQYHPFTGSPAQAPSGSIQYHLEVEVPVGSFSNPRLLGRSH